MSGVSDNRDRQGQNLDVEGPRLSAWLARTHARNRLINTLNSCGSGKGQLHQLTRADYFEGSVCFLKGPSLDTFCGGAVLGEVLNHGNTSSGTPEGVTFGSLLQSRNCRSNSSLFWFELASLITSPSCIF